jgi:hypothetical protein
VLHVETLVPWRQFEVWALGLKSYPYNPLPSDFRGHYRIEAKGWLNALAEVPSDCNEGRWRQFLGGLVELKQMAATPCSMSQFRQYIHTVFADQLEGTVNDVRGDKSTARPKILEDLPAWPSLQRKFEGDAIGYDLSASRGTAWSAYQAVTEFISHECGRAKDPDDAARQRLESMYWGPGSDRITTAHQYALSMR